MNPFFFIFGIPIIIFFIAIEFIALMYFVSGLNLFVISTREANKVNVHQQYIP
jgi:hypothetical protein